MDRRKIKKKKLKKNYKNIQGFVKIHGSGPLNISLKFLKKYKNARLWSP